MDVQRVTNEIYHPCIIILCVYVSVVVSLGEKANSKKSFARCFNSSKNKSVAT